MIDNQDIYQILPKHTSRWACEDVQAWLRLNGLDELAATFAKLNIDGPALAAFTQDRIIKELKVSSRFYLKKLVQWVEVGNLQYNDYVSQQQMWSQPTKPCTTDRSAPSDLSSHYLSNMPSQFTSQKPSFDVSCLDSNLQSKPEPAIRSMQKLGSNYSNHDNNILNNLNISNKVFPTHDRAQPHSQSLKPILSVVYLNKQYRSEANVFKIGRALTSDVKLMEEVTSREHCQIFKHNGVYYLKDKSRFGTFIESQNRTQLHQKMTIRIGTLQFHLLKININKSSFDALIRLQTITKKYKDYQFSNRIAISIGQKHKDFEDMVTLDTDICGSHARIIYEDGRVYLQNVEGLCYFKLHEADWFRVNNNNVKLSSKSIMRVSVSYECEVCRGSFKVAEIQQFKGGCPKCDTET